MNMKKVMLALACVLAATVAALPAKAQPISFAERQAMREVYYTALQAQKAQKDSAAAAQTNTASAAKQKPAASTEKELYPYYLAGREGKMMQSGEFFYSLLKRKDNASRQQADSLTASSVKKEIYPYHLAGREGKMMQSGEIFYSLIKRKDNICRQKADSLARAIEKANIEQAKRNAAQAAANGEAQETAQPTQIQK